MDNIEIILNQNKNINYLGKFYNRGKLEFPILRKIYESSELTKSNLPNSNNNEYISKLDNNETISKLDNNEPISKLDSNETISKLDNNEPISKLDNNETISRLEINNQSINKKATINESFVLTTSNIVFLWVSSLIIMYGIEYQIFRNLF